MFLKDRNISSKIKRSKVTDYAALIIISAIIMVHALSIVSFNKLKNSRLLFGGYVFGFDG